MGITLSGHRRWIVLGGLAFSAIFLVLAGRRLDWESVSHALSTARLWPWLPASVLFYLAGQLFRGIRCQHLVSRDARLSTFTATNIVVIGYAFNNIFPARMGELARAGMLSERSGMPFTQSLTITFLERVLDGLVILLLFVTVTAISPVGGWIETTVEVVAPLFGLAALGVLFAVVSPQYLTALTTRLASPLPRRFHDAAIRLAASVTQGVAYLQDPLAALRVSLLSVLVWLLEAGMFFCVLPVFGLPARYETAVLAMTITNLGLLVPSSPGFIGPFHYFCMQTLVTLGVAEATALSYAIVVHLAFYIPITVWGVVATLWYGIELGSTAAMARAARDLPPLSASPDLELQVLSSSRQGQRIEPPGELIIALTEAILPLETLELEASVRREVVVKVATFVHGQAGALPGQLRGLFHLGMTGFRLLVHLRYLRSFCALPLEKRRAVVSFWAYGPLSLTRQLFRLVRSTALLAFFELPVVQRAMAADASGQSASIGEATLRGEVPTGPSLPDQTTPRRAFEV